MTKTINLGINTQEIVFRRPCCPLMYYLMPSIDGVALVSHVKSLGVIITGFLIRLTCYWTFKTLQSTICCGSSVVKVFPLIN